MPRKKSLKTQALNAYAELLSARIGTTYNWESNEHTKLLQQLFANTRWAKPASESGTTLKVSNCSVRGRQFRAIELLTENDSKLPLTKAQISKEFATIVDGVAEPKRGNKKTRAIVLATMREIVKPQIQDYREKVKLVIQKARDTKNTQLLAKVGKCPITGKQLLRGRNHVDHIGKPFIRIADEWLEYCGFSAYTDVDGHFTRGNKFMFVQELHDSWFEFHKKHAKYQLCSANANMSKGSDGYVSKFKS